MLVYVCEMDTIGSVLTSFFGMGWGEGGCLLLCGDWSGLSSGITVLFLSLIQSLKFEYVVVACKELSWSHTEHFFL